MAEKSLVAYEAPISSHVESVLIIEQFLMDNYQFRRNVLNGKVEFAVKAVPLVAAWGQGSENGRETGETSILPPVPPALCTSAFEQGDGRKGGIFWNSLKKQGNHEYRNGTRLIPPALQEKIRNLFRTNGWTDEVTFDSYVEDYDW